MYIIDTILLYIIVIVHTLIVMFFLLVPFFGNNYMLLMHVVFLPFIVLHWLFNNNTCILSTIEIYIRQRLGMDDDKNKCFTCKLINPIYDFVSDYNQWSNIIYTVTLILWLISVYKLLHAYSIGKIQKFDDLLLGDVNGFINHLFTNSNI